MSGPEPEWTEQDDNLKISDDEQDDEDVQEHYSNVTDAAGGAVGLLMEGPQATWKEEDDNLKISDDEREEEVADVVHYSGVTDAAGGAVGLLMSGPEPEWVEADDTLRISDDEQEVDGTLLVDEAKLTGATSVIDLLMGTDEPDDVDVKVGTRFQMGSLFYAVDSVSEYVVCVQIEALRAAGFPTQVLLEPSQFAHVRVMSDEDYDAAVAAYKPTENEDKKEKSEQVEDKESGLTEGDRFNMGGVHFVIETM